MTKEELLKEIDIIFEKITLIHVSIVYYKKLIDLRKNNSEIYSAGEIFFNSVTRGYDYVIACELPKIFNQKEQKGSIYSILNACKASHLIKESTINNFKTIIKEKLFTVDQIKKYRDKVLAHSDKEFFGNNKLYEENPFCIDKYDELKQTAISLLSDIRSEIEGINYIFTTDMIKCDFIDLILSGEFLSNVQHH